jgi:hypothetical protein
MIHLDNYLTRSLSFTNCLAGGAVWPEPRPTNHGEALRAVFALLSSPVLIRLSSAAYSSGWMAICQTFRKSLLLILPGTADLGAVDGPGADDAQKGYIWDAVKRAGKTFRNYGYHCDQVPIFCRTVSLRRSNAIRFPRTFGLVSRREQH